MKVSPKPESTQTAPKRDPYAADACPKGGYHFWRVDRRTFTRQGRIIDKSICVKCGATKED